MQVLLILFLITSVLLWGFAAAIWNNDSVWNLIIRLISIGMLISACLLLVGILAGLLIFA